MTTNEPGSRAISPTDLVRRVAGQTGRSQRVVRQVLGASLETMQSALAAGSRVTVPGFGTWYTRQRPASQVRAVRTGRQVAVPARRVAAFRVGDILKRAVARKEPGRRRVFGL